MGTEEGRGQKWNRRRTEVEQKKAEGGKLSRERCRIQKVRSNLRERKCREVQGRRSRRERSCKAAEEEEEREV